MILQIDLLGLDLNDLTWYQMGIRAIIVSIVAIALIRVAGIRSFGTSSPFNVVLVITLGALLCRCIAGHYSFYACLFGATVLAFFHRLVAYLSFKSKFINKLTEGDPILLYKDGKKMQRNLSREYITEEDLLKCLREEHLDDFNNVKSIWLEPDGKISVVKIEN